jgi:hypothetical protein
LLLPALAPVAAQEEAGPADSTSAAAGPTVAEAAICLRVEDRSPVEPGERFPADVGELACFTRIDDGAGLTVIHAWIHEGTTRARVELSVGESDSWRLWSTKRILPSWTGSWEVKVMTPDGAVLESIPFTIY